MQSLVEPAYFSVPDYYQTFGPEVGELAALAGFVPDPEQQLILDPMFGLDRFGKSAAFEVAVIACRQNIKTGLMKIAALGKTVIMERPLFVWSAHEFRTAQEAFRDLTILIESCPDLDQMVKRIYRGNGDESIEWLGGQRIIFKARTKSGGRGLTGDDVGLDEGFALMPAHMGALLPTLSARPDPQVIYGSSAGLAMSEVLRGVRDRGRAGNDRRLAYIEFCSPPPAEVCARGDACDHALTTAGCGCDDPGNWQFGNSQLGRRIPVENVAAERRALPPNEFGRERMGWWEDPEDAVVLDWAAWTALTDPESAPADPYSVAFAVDVAPDRSSGSIALAGDRRDGLQHVEIVDHRKGIGWIVRRVAELVETWSPSAVVLDGGGPVGALLAAFTEAGIETVNPSAREVGQASGMFYDAVITEATLRHRPDGLLDAALLAAKKRPLGDAWTWDRRDLTDISPLVAATLALWGYAVHGRNAGPNIW